MKLYRSFGCRTSQLAILAALAMSHQAHAAPQDPAAIVDQICAEPVSASKPASLPDIDYEEARWRAVDKQRIAYFLIASTGRMVTPGEASALINAVDGPDHYPDGAGNLWDTVMAVQDETAAGNIDGFMPFDASGVPVSASSIDRDRTWLMSVDIVARCQLPGEARSKANKIDLRLRGTTEALAAEGKALRTAEAASVGLSRTRDFQDDGTRKQVTTLKVSAVLGAPLPGSDRLSGLIGYVGYELDRERTKPRPALTPPATERDADTEILKFGLIGNKLFNLSTNGPEYQTSLDVAIDAAYLANLVDDSKRFRGRVTAGLYDYGGLPGVCAFGDYVRFAGTKLWTRCDFVLIGEANILTDRGMSNPTAKDSFAHAGGRAAFSAYLGETVEDGPFFTAEYVNLQRLSGDSSAIPNIVRHRFKLGYRWWAAPELGLEFRAELADGINRDSLADENKLSLGFGIIF